MFDFEKLTVYQKSKQFAKEISKLISDSIDLEYYIKNQIGRASFSIMLNIAEGTGRVSKKDRRHFYVISRGSVFECVAVLDFLKDEKTITAAQYSNFYKQAEELSKMLFSMIKQLS